MKRNIYLILPILCLALFFGSCTSNNPKSVAEKFLNSIYVNTDADEAKKYCDSNTQELIDQATHLNPIPDSVKASAKSTVIKIVEVKENGNSAVVVYTSSKHPDDKQLLSLAKTEDKWLVQYTKEEQYEEEPLMHEAIEVIKDSSSNASSIRVPVNDSATD